MTRTAWVLLVIAFALAALDWLAVARANLRLRWAFKPGAIVLLVGVALSLRPASGEQRYLFVVALLLSLAGDLLLLSPSERGFRTGLAAFLAAHIAYGVGFVAGGVSPGLLTYAAPAVAVVSLAAGGRILRSVLATGSHSLALAVLAYLLAISAMVALAAAGGKPTGLAAAALFYASDGMIAWNRYVRPLPWSRLPVIVTYHLAQAGLVLTLAL